MFSSASRIAIDISLLKILFFSIAFCNDFLSPIKLEIPKEGNPKRPQAFNSFDISLASEMGSKFDKL